MKTVKLVGMLTLVVVLFSLLVWVTNDLTAPIIAERKIEEANAAKFEVLPGLNASTDADALENPVSSYDLTDTTITELYVFEGKGYIYKAEYQGFANPVIYLVGIDMAGNVTGLKILEQNDSPGYGQQIGEAWFGEQFAGKTATEVQDGDFDVIAGVSATFGGFTSSSSKVMLFHNTTFGGVVAETPEERYIRLQLEIFPLANSYVDVTADYPSSNAVVTINEVYDADDALIGVLYHSIADGASVTGPSTQTFLLGIDLEGNIANYRMIESTDTPGYYDLYLTPEFGDLYQGIAVDGDLSVDDGAGATRLSLESVVESVEFITQYHVNNFSASSSGESDAAIFAKLTGTIFGAYTDLEDITRDNPASHDIDKIADIYNDGVYLGVSYFVEVEIGDVVYSLVIGVNTAGEVISTEYIIEDDEYTGAEITAVTDLVLAYHTANGLGRPVAPVLDDADLLLAFAGADHFVSVYNSLTYNSRILNVYEAQDATDAVLGYVYHFTATGRSSSHIEIVYGFDIAGSTVTIGVLTGDTETWDDAAFDSYNGGEMWPNTTWLDNWENQVIDDIDDSQIDTVAGVTQTTGGVKTAIEEVIDFHKTEIIGGGS
ncbi:FMN-binding protein [Candidatus Izimaplasma bacterium]|nr:FMN-binding protein [Candidatus Izimaplasma bacterium]